MKRLFNKGTVFCAAAIMYAALAVYYVACKFTAPQECRLCKMTPGGCDKEDEAPSDTVAGFYGTDTSFPEVTWELMPYNFFMIKESSSEEINHDPAL